MYLNCKEISFKEICGFECSSSQSIYHFGFIVLSNNNAGSFNFVSISQWSTTTQGSSSTTILCGCIHIQNANISNNNVFSNSAIAIHSNNLTFLFSSMVKNRASGSITLDLGSTNNESMISFLNVIDNSYGQPYNGIVYISSNGHHSISNSIFQQNLNTLFYISSGLLRVSNCKVNHLRHMVGISINETINIITTHCLINVHQISHYSTHQCLTVGISLIFSDIPVFRRSIYSLFVFFGFVFID